MTLIESLKAFYRRHCRRTPKTKPGCPPVPVVPGDPSTCVILVPVAHHIEPACDEALRELERRGYVVWRKWGFSAIDQGRCLLAQQALDAGFRELFWIDADIAFWADDVDKVRSLGLSIVAGAYPVKGWPTMTMEPLDKGLPIHFGPGAPLVSLRYAATGFLYTHRRVYHMMRLMLELPTARVWGQHSVTPWFLPLLYEGDYLGEDFAFCHRAREVGYTIHLDPSIRLAHIGRHPYSWRFVAGGKPATEPTTLTYQPPEVTRESAGG
jgi:hypothetical protein